MNVLFPFYPSFPPLLPFFLRLFFAFINLFSILIDVALHIFSSWLVMHVFYLLFLLSLLLLTDVFFLNCNPPFLFTDSFTLRISLSHNIFFSWSYLACFFFHSLPLLPANRCLVFFVIIRFFYALIQLCSVLVFINILMQASPTLFYFFFSSYPSSLFMLFILLSFIPYILLYFVFQSRIFFFHSTFSRSKSRKFDRCILDVCTN